MEQWKEKKAEFKNRIKIGSICSHEPSFLKYHNSPLPTLGFILMALKLSLYQEAQQKTIWVGSRCVSLELNTPGSNLTVEIYSP